MIAGWVRDHVTGPLVLCLVAAVAFGHRGSTNLGSPLGDGFTGVTVATALVLVSAASASVSLRSSICTHLCVDDTPRRRSIWIGAVLGVHAAVVILVSAPTVSWDRVLCVAGLTAGGACLLTTLAGDAPGLLYVFALFCACALTPRLEAPWWNPFVLGSGETVRLWLAAVTVVGAWLCYVAGAGRRP